MPNTTTTVYMRKAGLAVESPNTSQSEGLVIVSDCEDCSDEGGFCDYA